MITTKKNKVLGAILCISTALAWPALSSADLISPQIDMCETLVKHRERVSVKPIARPPLLRLFKEPAFGTKIMRITNSRTGQVMKPSGNPAQAWNIDESLMLLHKYDSKGESRVVMLDGSSYAELGTLNIPSVHAERVFWSHTDPLKIYFVGNNPDDAGKLTEFNVTSGKNTLIQDFAPVCKKAGVPAIGGLLSKPSHDDDLFGYQCGVANNKSLAISHRISTGKTYTARTGRGTKFPVDMAPEPASDGKSFWFAGSVLNEALKNTGVKLDLGDHTAPSTLGIDVNGDPMLYQAASKRSPRGCSNDIWRGLGLLVEHDLSDGECGTVITQTDGYPPTPEGTDLFASAYRAPQWLMASAPASNDSKWFKGKRPAPRLFSEIYMINAHDARDNEVCRLAHHRSYGAQARNATYPAYLGNPSATLSPTATRAVFSTDWYDSGFVDTYVIELPSFTTLDLDGFWIDTEYPDVVTEFVQAGSKLVFSRIYKGPTEVPPILTTGSGNIDGAKIDLNYTVHLARDKRIKGECSTRTKEGAKEILFKCYDIYYGNVSFELQRP